MKIFVSTVGDEDYHLAQAELFRELARRDSVGRHELVLDPRHADAVWFVDLHQHPDDRFMRAFRRHPLVRSLPTRVMVYDERDRPMLSAPGIYVSARASARWPALGGPYARLPSRPVAATVQPDLLFSFSGARTHPVRADVLGLRDRRAVIRDTTGTNFFGWVEGADVVDAQRDYYELIARSKFVLCPRGHGPSSFRVYETLGSGRVPVVISDDWLVPRGVDWARCAVRVAERDVHAVPHLLRRLEDDWSVMAQAALEAAEAFGPGRLWDRYAESLADLLGCRVRRPWWAQREVLRSAAVGVRGARWLRAG